MYNFEVASTHAYFVGAGWGGVWVHNLCIGTPNGDVIVVPEGATGPTPTKNGLGMQFQGGKGGLGLSPQTTGVRVMDPTLPNGSSPGYPNGYSSYNIKSGQTCDPYTGQTIDKSNPAWHNPL